MPTNEATERQPDVAMTAFSKVVDATARTATSWVGLVTGYVAAVSAAILAFDKLAEPLEGWRMSTRIALVGSIPAAVIVFQIIPALIEQKRRKRLRQISGTSQAGYFRLAPREDEASFKRADGKHEEVLKWLGERSGDHVLYLTGASGTGKSSLLAAWVLPHLERQGVRIIRLRAYQDPLAELEKELRKPGVVWQKPSTERQGLESILVSARRHIRPERLLVVLDQFEEFVILQDFERQRRFEEFFYRLRENDGPGITFLFVFRSDYIGLIEKLSLPPLIQDTNWKEVPPFTESAAVEFMQASGLKVNDSLLRDVLREAAEIEQAKGLLRPITINLCGLVLGRFASGLPRGFRPGGLIRGFVRESILLPSIREVSPRLIPHLITGHITKRPRTITQLAEYSGLDAEEVRGCLRTMGQSDRAIVRPLDANHQTWEISHDFLVPLLDSITARLRVSLWRRTRPWLPWIGAAAMVVVAVAVWNWKQDPLSKLMELGWQIEKSDKTISLYHPGAPPKESVVFLRRLNRPLDVRLDAIDDGISDWSVLSNLDSLRLGGAKSVSNLEPLRNLKQLSKLQLNATSVTNLEPLKGLENLTTLDLSETSISNLEPLKGLKNLSELNLSKNILLEDVKPLAGLEGLTKLDLNNTFVNDLGPLKGLKKLTELDLSNTKITNLAPLEGLENLTTLDLSNTPVKDSEPLKGLKKLTGLDLSSTKIPDLEPLKGLENLITLDLDDNELISDLRPLGNLAKLSELDLSNTNITDLGPLKDMKRLTKLNLSSTKIHNRDLESLKNLETLTKLDLSDNDSISDVGPLRNLAKLSELDLSSTLVSNLEPLRNLTKLSVLKVKDTQVSEADVNDLKNWNSNVEFTY